MIPESDRLARILLGRLAKRRRHMWMCALGARRVNNFERMISYRRSHEDVKVAYQVVSHTYRLNSTMPKYAQETA
jgi:hypothetical protein